MQMLGRSLGGILALNKGVKMLTILGTLVWLVLPVSATVIGYFLLRRKLNADPNANIEAGVNSLREFRSLLNSDQD
jgi:hypothetical protein